jgi:hypothetical protein
LQLGEQKNHLKSELRNKLCIFVRINLIVMDTKLTLKLNQEVIEKAKQYASDKKLSLSRLIENYLNSLTSDKSNKNELEISPFVKSLSDGTKYSIPTDYDYKKDRADYLDKKYK